MLLINLEKGKNAKVSSIIGDDETIIAKLREIGFAEGDDVEIMHYGPFGKTPICIRLNRTMIALRPNEAALIEVKVV